MLVPSATCSSGQARWEESSYTLRGRSESLPLSYINIRGGQGLEPLHHLPSSLTRVFIEFGRERSSRSKETMSTVPVVLQEVYAALKRRSVGGARWS